MLAALSDIHFGLDSCTLKEPANVDKLISALRKARVKEIVLLGDIFEFWDCPPERAIADSRYFFDALSGFDANLVFIPGNHDHHLKAVDWELNRYGSGNPPSMPYRLKDASLRYLFSSSKITAHYHEYAKVIGGRNFLFTHGHYFIEENNILPRILRQMGSVRKQIKRSVSSYRQRGIQEDSLEKLLSEIYETVYWSTFIGGLKGGLSEFWYDVEALLTRIRGRDSLQEYFKKTYSSALEYIGGRDIDCLVFGHSHRAGIYNGKSGLALVNLGAWCTAGVYEQDAINSYMIADDTHIEIRRI